MTFLKFAPLALLALAACSQEPDAPEAPAPSAAIPAEPTPSAATTAATTPEGVIPAAYQGAWDWTGGTCQTDSDQRTEIGGSEIHFYESVGKVQAVRENGGVLEVDLAMEGEGMQWTQTTVLRMADGGLLETEFDDPDSDGKLRLKRCPGEATAP